jgi:uncharacterized protein YaaW (UPF0174 family)
MDDKLYVNMMLNWRNHLITKVGGFIMETEINVSNVELQAKQFAEKNPLEHSLIGYLCKKDDFPLAEILPYVGQEKKDVFVEFMKKIGELWKELSPDELTRLEAGVFTQQQLQENMQEWIKNGTPILLRVGIEQEKFNEILEYAQNMQH